MKWNTWCKFEISENYVIDTENPNGTKWSVALEDQSIGSEMAFVVQIVIQSKYVRLAEPSMKNSYSDDSSRKVKIQAPFCRFQFGLDLGHSVVLGSTSEHQLRH